MVDNPAAKRQDETFRLLKFMKAGGDHAKAPRTPHAAVIGGVRCTSPKRSYFKRWPEIVSAFWIVVILFVIGFLAFKVSTTWDPNYLKTNNLKQYIAHNEPTPVADVYYHLIVQKREVIPLKQYSKFLTDMAEQYPYLRFHVYFLKDDTVPVNFLSACALHSKFNRPFENQYDEMNIRLSECLMKKNSNLNIYMLPLSFYMSNTPLTKWRTVPLTYLTFYIRVYSVWKNGGIALELHPTSYKNALIERKNKRITEIFKRFNAETTRIVDYEDRSVPSFIKDLLSMLFGKAIVFNNSLNHVDSGKEHRPYDNLVRTHRSKRYLADMNEIPPFNNTKTDEITEIIPSIDSKNITEANKLDLILNDTTTGNENGTSTTQQIFLYDVYIYSDNEGLTIDLDGKFLATAVRKHPFLAQIMYSEYQYMNPSLTIVNSYNKECIVVIAGAYCNNIAFI